MNNSHFLSNYTYLQDILLKRAADALETFYSLPRPHSYNGGGAGPLTHGNYYLSSPAVFAVTQQQMHQPLLSPNRGKMSALPSIEGGRDNSNTNGVSRCSSGEQPVGVEGSGQNFFNFPQAQADVKLEQMGGGIHKPKPVTPGVYPVAMPFLQVAHMPQGTYSGYPAGSTDMNGFMVMGEEHESNRNNNNSNIGFSHPMVATAGWHGNPIHLIPPSPLFMAPTGKYIHSVHDLLMNQLFIHQCYVLVASPGPLPITPNGPGGSTVFNFPMMSPAKPIRAMLPGNRGGKNSDGLLHPTGGGTINYQPTMLAGI